MLEPSQVVTRPRRPLLPRGGASQYLRETWGIERKPSTLAKLAVTGGGPQFYKANQRPLYDPDYLDDGRRSCLAMRVGRLSDAPRGGAEPGDGTIFPSQLGRSPARRPQGRRRSSTEQREDLTMAFKQRKTSDAPAPIS